MEKVANLIKEKISQCWDKEAYNKHSIYHTGSREKMDASYEIDGYQINFNFRHNYVDVLCINYQELEELRNLIFD